MLTRGYDPLLKFTMKKIILFLLIFISISFAEEFVPNPKVGDNWIVRREITEYDNIEKNTKIIQYWKYEVINIIQFNNEEYLVILITSKDVNVNIKLMFKSKNFILKEITNTIEDKSTTLELEEVSAPVIEIEKMARLYDLPAFPLIDPNVASENVNILPNGEKRIRRSFTRHHSSRGDVVTSELIWQETDKIKKEDIISYSRKEEDYINKINQDGYYLLITGEKRKIKQIWVESVPWWIYSESTYEKDYLVNYYSGGMK